MKYSYCKSSLGHLAYSCIDKDRKILLTLKIAKLLNVDSQSLIDTKKPQILDEFVTIV